MKTWKTQGTKYETFQGYWQQLQRQKMLSHYIHLNHFPYKVNYELLSFASFLRHTQSLQSTLRQFYNYKMLIFPHLDCNHCFGDTEKSSFTVLIFITQRAYYARSHNKDYILCTCVSTRRNKNDHTNKYTFY